MSCLNFRSPKSFRPAMTWRNWWERVDLRLTVNHMRLLDQGFPGTWRLSTHLNKVGLSPDTEHGIPSFISLCTTAQLAPYARPRFSFESGQVSIAHFFDVVVVSFSQAFVLSLMLGIA